MSGRARVRRVSRSRRRCSGAEGPDRHALLKRMLDERDAAVRRKLHALREGPRDEEAGPTDVGDRVQSDLLREIDASLLEREGEAQTAIWDALRRVEGGSGEACSRCRGPIGRARLRAVPFTELCKACQEREELAGARSDAAR